MRTNSFVCTVCRFAVGTPGGRALRIVYRTLAVGDAAPASCVQELPDSYKSVRFLRLPLRGRHAESSCPTNRLSQLLRRARPLGAP